MRAAGLQPTGGSRVWIAGIDAEVVGLLSCLSARLFRLL